MPLAVKRPVNAPTATSINSIHNTEQAVFLTLSASVAYSLNLRVGIECSMRHLPNQRNMRLVALLYVVSDERDRPYVEEICTWRHGPRQNNFPKSYLRPISGAIRPATGPPTVSPQPRLGSRKPSAIPGLIFLGSHKIPSNTLAFCLLSKLHIAVFWVHIDACSSTCRLHHPSPLSRCLGPIC